MMFLEWVSNTSILWQKSAMLEGGNLSSGVLVPHPPYETLIIIQVVGACIHIGVRYYTAWTCQYSKTHLNRMPSVMTMMDLAYQMMNSTIIKRCTFAVQLLRLEPYHFYNNLLG